jgi:hypothetical protein
MAQTVYLHIGHGRCGSTSIQNFAGRERTELAARGLVYPSDTEMGFPVCVGGNAQAIYKARRQPGTLELVKDYLDGQPQTNFLLSSEWLLYPEELLVGELADALNTENRTVKVIAYVREQREWLMSRYAQAVKSKRWTLSLDEYMREAFETPGLDYTYLFRRVADAVGRERMTVRLFDRSHLIGGDVRSDIFAQLGVEVDDLLCEEDEANASASVEELEVARLVSAGTTNEEFNPRRFLGAARKLVAERGWSLERRLYRLVDPSLMKELAGYYAKRNEEFRKEFLPEIPAPLFDNRIPAEYKPMSDVQRINERSLVLLSSYYASLLAHERALAGERTKRAKRRGELRAR